VDRTYNQYCATARTLDLVGERWTLLLVRDLLTGPKRFGDLQKSLRGMGTGLLAARMKHLEREGLVEKITLPPPARTPAQQARLAAFLGLFQLPENFVLTDMGYVTFAMSDLVHDHRKLKGRIGVGNENVVYGDPVTDAQIERVSPHPGAAHRLQEDYTPTGNVGNVKIVSLHTDKDGLVFVENESEYASVVPASNLTTAVVVEAVPSHCGFTPAEAVAGWETLRGWVAGGPQPTAAGIQGLCAALAPTVGGPCRIDPTFVIPDMDGRIRPR